LHQNWPDDIRLGRLLEAIYPPGLDGAAGELRGENLGSSHDFGEDADRRSTITRRGSLRAKSAPNGCDSSIGASQTPVVL
jgi:hypothetical protein